MVDSMQELIDLVWIIVPLLMVQITLTGTALWQWNKKKENLGQNKLIWILIILFLNFFGSVIFLIYSQGINAYDTSTPSNGETDDWEV
jgi:hypothetical protein